MHDVARSLQIAEMIISAESRPNHMALLAESVAIQGRLDDALSIIAQTRTLAELGKERHYLPEILRPTGAWSMQKGLSAPGDLDATERVLRDAVALARKQEARGFELRAATTLATFAQKTGRAPDARAGLAQIVDAFTEGFDTRDFREARNTLAAFG